MDKHDIEFWGCIIAIKAVMITLAALYAYYVTM